MRIKKLLVSAIFFASTPVMAKQAPTDSATFATPFGLQGGMTQQELMIAVPDAKCDKDRQSCTFDSAPVNIPGATSYGAVFFGDGGLCRVWSIIMIDGASAYGDEVKERFQSLNSALKKKYGRPSNEFDFIRKGSIWNEPRDWMMSMAKKERELTTYWIRGHKDRPASLPKNLDSIALKARAASAQVGAVVLTYDFENIDRCIEAQKSKSSQGL